IFPQCQIAQFDCSVCTSEEADEAGTYRDDPRRIDSGHNLDVDEPSLQHSTAKCTAKPKNDPNNKDKRRLQGCFPCRSQRAGPRIHAQVALADPVFAEILQYSTLTRAALESTKIIAESLTQFKRTPDAPALPD